MNNIHSHQGVAVYDCDCDPEGDTYEPTDWSQVQLNPSLWRRLRRGDLFSYLFWRQRIRLLRLCRHEFAPEPNP